MVTMVTVHGVNEMTTSAHVYNNHKYIVPILYLYILYLYNIILPPFKFMESMCTLHTHKYHAEATAGFSDRMKAVDQANLVLHGHNKGRGLGTQSTGI